MHRCPPLWLLTHARATLRTPPLPCPLRPPAAGTIYIDAKAICLHLGWKVDEVCMPCQMAYDVLICETYCPYGHPQGCKKQLRRHACSRRFRCY